MELQRHPVDHFILSFDLPREHNTARVRIFRRLRGMGAKMVHESFWKHNNLNKLIEVAIMIKRLEGKASILEERLLF